MIMKLPNVTGSGYYGHDASILSYLSDGSDVGNGDDDADPPTLDVDFSEYMWMENEEEFDKQVMQQLEEEALMEQCIEAMLEDECEIHNIYNQAMAANGVGVVDACQPWSAGTDYVHPTNAPDLCQTMENLSVQDDLAMQSTLNPNAAEFVPQHQSAELSGSGRSLHSETS